MINNNNNQIVKAENLLSTIQFATFSGREIVQAALDTKIRNLDNDEPIRQALRYVFALVGLKAENFPSEIQKAVLIDFIQTDLKDFSPDEIKIAFRLAVNGQLNVEINHFQNFSALYIANVFNAYKEHRAKAMIEFNRKIDRVQVIPQQPSDAEKAREFWNFVETFIVQKFEQYRDKGIFEGTLNGFEQVFSILEKKLELLVLSIDQKKAIHERAKDIQQNRFESRKFNSKDEARSMRLLAKKVLEQGFEQTFEHEIKKICFEIAVREYYDNLIQSGSDLRATIKSIQSNQYE